MRETDVIEELLERVTHEEIGSNPMQRMKSEKATRPSEVSVKMMVASGKIGIEVMMDLCQCILDGGGMPDE